MPHKRNRKKGATLTLVAAIALAIIIIGVGFFFLMKIWGGGRELSNATDAGILNVAKAAIRFPKKDALQFTNPDVGTNFALLGEDPRNLNLMTYNRLFAQALIVAINAKDEGTTEAGASAKKVWTALNDVGTYLRTNLQDSAVMGSYFQNLAGMNNVKMLGGNSISLGDYEVSFLKRGGSTNVHVDPVILSTFSTNPGIPINTSGSSSSSGQKYLAGYAPFSVNVPGATLFFSGVPVLPQDRPHLVDLTNFLWNNKDDFIQGSGAPAYPVNTLPPNTFRASGVTLESKSNKLTNSTACAIVSCMTQDFEMAVPFGYLEIRNGPSTGGPKGGLAFQAKDVFCHALAGQGISVTGLGEWFCRGSDAEVADVKNLDTSFNKLPDLQAEVVRLIENYNADTLTVGRDPDSMILRRYNQILYDVSEIKQQLDAADDLIDRWALVNSYDQATRDYLWQWNIPDRAISLKYIRKRDGSVLQEEELKQINKRAEFNCHWTDYTSGMKKWPCLEMLPEFKKGYNEYGTVQQNDGGTGYTALEQFKCDVMSNRVGCVNAAAVSAPAETSGMKWFTHTGNYPAPKGPYNFGQVKTAYDYLEMIDKAPSADGCALGSVSTLLLKRCQQISPKVKANDLTNALKSQPLPLGTTLYLYVDNGSLVLKREKPAWLVAGTRADGKVPSSSETCGKPYNVMGSLVCTASGAKSDWPYGGVSAMEGATISNDPNTDGMFPGWAWKTMPNAECRDEAVWVPSTGYNNFLGYLEFRNSCKGGGTFAQPN